MLSNGLESNKPPEKFDNSQECSSELTGLTLDDGVNETICAYLPLKELGIFSRTSSQGMANTALLRLQKSILTAVPEDYDQLRPRLASIAILKRYPYLLFKTRGQSVTDHYGREVIDVPYRILLGTFDIWALKQVHEEILPLIHDGEKQAKAQFGTHFPNLLCQFDSIRSEEDLYDDRNRDQLKKVESHLKLIVQKITADPCTNGLATLDETKNAVAELQKIFTTKKEEILRTGLHFPQGIMIMIIRSLIPRWTTEQKAYYSFAVVGAAEAASTAVDGQCYKHGFHRLIGDTGPDRRDGLLCSRPKGIPKDKAPLNSKLGDSLFVDPTSGNSSFISDGVSSIVTYKKDGPISIPERYINRSLSIELSINYKVKILEELFDETNKEVNQHRV